MCVCGGGVVSACVCGGQTGCFPQLFSVLRSGTGSLSELGVVKAPGLLL